MPAVAEANAAQAKPQEAASSEDIRKDINGALHLSEQEKVIPGNSALSAFLLALFERLAALPQYNKTENV